MPVPALELVAVAAERGPQFPLGTRWSYSNTNYLPLGLIAERATGVPIEAQLQRRLFRPLRMTRTTLPRTLTIPVSARPGATPAAWT